MRLISFRFLVTPINQFPIILGSCTLYTPVCSLTCTGGDCPCTGGLPILRTAHCVHFIPANDTKGSVFGYQIFLATGGDRTRDLYWRPVCYSPWDGYTHPPPPRGNFGHYDFLIQQYLSHKMRHVSILRSVTLPCYIKITYVTQISINEQFLSFMFAFDLKCSHNITNQPLKLFALIQGMLHM